MDATKEITNKGNEIEGREVKIEKTKETEDKKEEIKVKESEKKVTNEEEEEELEEDDDDDEKEKIALKGQKVIIELNGDLKNHIKEKKFELNNKLTFDFEFIYDIISRKILYKKLVIIYYDNYASILYKKFNYMFFYKLVSVEINLIFNESSDNKSEKFFICSTYELLQYCNLKNYKPYLIIDNAKYEFNYIFDTIYPQTIAKLDKILLEQDYRKYDDYIKEDPPTNFPINKSELEPKKLSKFFDLFFKFETKSNFEYWESDKRKNFIFFVLRYQSNEDIHCFKMCGPSGIGKSMTLFLISRYYYNFLYFNLKTIKQLKDEKDYLSIHNILIESCKYLQLTKKQVNALSSLINKKAFVSFFSCLKDIIKFLIKYKLLSVIILDQFKYDTIDKQDYNDIMLLISEQKEEKKKVKLLICSSTNDKEIREECIKSWKLKIFFLTQHSIEYQNYYFYISELFVHDAKVNDSYDIVLNNFNYIPKYKNKFKYLKEEKSSSILTDKLNQDLKDIENKVEKNLKDLYRILNRKELSEEVINMKMIESLRYLYLNIDKNLEYKELEEFMSICSFKYYIFKFEINYFSINYSFTYMKEIVNKIIDTHLEDFYKYMRNKEHSGSASSDFFELFSGKSIKDGKLELPESKGSICIKVNEIVKMNEFSSSNLDNLIKEEIYSNLKIYKVKKDNFIIGSKNINQELEERNLLLSLSADNYISYDDQGLEYYKLNYINELNKENKEYNISGNPNLGDMSVFINQKNQRGRKFDLAYVYGKKDNKTFIGFQMKAYDEEASHDINLESSKKNIKKSLQPMIINIKYLMDMDIKFWHYVVIILYDKTKKEGKQYFQKAVELCQNNGLEYIFYEPSETQFYNRNLEIINKFIPNQMSNLDNNIEDILPINIINDLDIEKYMKDFSDYIQEKKYNNANYIKEGLLTLINKKRKREESIYKNKKQMKDEIKSVLSEIYGDLRLKFNFKSIKFVVAYKFINSENIPIPKKNFLFLMESNKEGIYIISFKNENNDNVYYEYKINSGIDNLDKNKSQIFNNLERKAVNAYINKEEKFYVFKYETK